MNVDLRILAFTNAGALSLASVVQADEHPMSQVVTTVSSTTLSGYVDTSMIWKAGTGDANLPGRAFDRVGKLDGFNLNVVKLKLEKPVSDELWATGYKVSLLFGPDATGFNTSANATPGAYDFSVEEAYVSLSVPAGNGIGNLPVWGWPSIWAGGGDPRGCGWPTGWIRPVNVGRS